MKNLTHCLPAILALTMVMSVGCIDFHFPFFANPLVDPADATVQKELFGSFVVIDVEKDEDDPIELDPELLRELELDEEEEDEPSVTIWHIGRAGKRFPRGFMRVATVDSYPNGKMEVRDREHDSCLFAVKVKGVYVIHQPLSRDKDSLDLPDDNTSQNRNKKWSPADYQGYMIALMKPTMEGFELLDMNSDFLDAEIKAGRLKGKSVSRTKEAKLNPAGEKKANSEPNSESATPDQKRGASSQPKDDSPQFEVNASTQELKEFFEKNIDRLTGEPIMILRRIK